MTAIKNVIKQTFLHVKIQSADIRESWKSSSPSPQSARGAKENRICICTVRTTVLEDANREDSIKWKSDLITFYFKKKRKRFYFLKA